MIQLLIIEDQPAVREVVAEIASDLGEQIKITQVGSIKEARPLLTSCQWHAVISDMSLGDGNALEWFQTISDDGFPLPPTILMSGFLTTTRMHEAKSLGIEYILAKPFTPHILLKSLKQILGIEEDDLTADKQRQRNSDHLLPEMFEMDRRLGLIYRMFDEMPAAMDVSEVCAHALNLGMEIVHGHAGYLALYERKRDQLVLVASEQVPDITPACMLDETAFRPLINGDEELHLSCSEGADKRCWTGVQTEPFVAVPVRLQGVPMGVLCLMQPGRDMELKNETRQMLGLLVKKLDTLLDNRAVHAALAANMRDTLIALVRSLEARDRYTRDHSARVGALSATLATDFGLDADHVDLIRTGGLLHDIGKCGVPDAVLLKPGRYTDQEFAIMKAHPAIGDNILANMDPMVRERLMLRHHHERFDGFGYPDKLAGEGIPLEARIVCVADAIDAMTTHRVYRMARPLSFCLEQLKLNSGTQFDPQIAEVAIAAIERGAVRTQAEEKKAIDDGVMPLSALISVKTEVRSYA